MIFSSAMLCPTKERSLRVEALINSATGSVINTNYSVEIKDIYS